MPEGEDVVLMTSMDVISWSYACRDALREISLIRSDGRAEHWGKLAAEAAAELRAHLWDETRHACFDQDKNGNTVDVLCHNNLRCMYWGSFSQEMADRFVKHHLLNEREFWTYLPLPSVAANDPAFRNAPENNWSGQCEGLTFQRAILALERYGYEKLVTHIGKRLMQCVIDGGYLFTQQYDPFTGAPSRVSPRTKRPLPPGEDTPCQDAYGPTLLAVLEYIAHIWGVQKHRGGWWFSLGSGAPYAYTQRWGDQCWHVESDGRTARVFLNERLMHTSPCGVRLICDGEGRLMKIRAIE